MGEYSKSDNVVLLFDNYFLESRNLHTSFKQAGKKYPVAVIEDDGFLPEDVISIYGYFLGDFDNALDIPQKPKYFNQIKVPKYWEISANNSSGKIYDLNKERGRIFYAEPKHRRLVKVIDWLDDRGVVRSSDHYNKYGALYARTVFNAKGQKVNKSYFSPDGKEIIVENYVTRDIILNENNTVKIFRSKQEFVCYFLEKSGLAQCRIFFNTLSTSFFVSQRMPVVEKQDVLFWQEPIGTEIPGNMRIILDGNASRTAKIMVQKKDAYDKLIALGASTEIIQKLGYSYAFKRENECKPQALICTNSDRIAHCRKLVESLPKIHFHIAAITEMSSKLMCMDSYENVTLYPGVKMETAKELFRTCDFYLDVNHEGEILSAVQNAFMHNQLIFAFKETLHNANYVAEVHTYAMNEVEQMIENIRRISADSGIMKRHIKMQHRWALLENAVSYLQI